MAFGLLLSVTNSPLWWLSLGIAQTTPSTSFAQVSSQTVTVGAAGSCPLTLVSIWRNPDCLILTIQRAMYSLIIAQGHSFLFSLGHPEGQVGNRNDVQNSGGHK